MLDAVVPVIFFRAGGRRYGHAVSFSVYRGIQMKFEEVKISLTDSLRRVLNFQQKLGDVLTEFLLNLKKTELILKSSIKKVCTTHNPKLSTRTHLHSAVIIQLL